MIGTYTIELPISKDLEFQQLFRGRKQHSQVSLLSIFPKEYLTTAMILQISQRAKHYLHIEEFLDNDFAFLISYRDSHLWLRFEQYLQSNPLQFPSLIQNLYQCYYQLQDELVDFDIDFVYVYQGHVFLMDYGLKLINENQPQTQFTKTKKFAFMILQLLNKQTLNSQIFENQQQLNKLVQSIVQTHKFISKEFVDILFRLIQLDLNIDFNELNNFPIFQKQKVSKQPNNSVLEFIANQSMSNRSESNKNSRPQSFDHQRLYQSNVHFFKVKQAVENKVQQKLPPKPVKVQQQKTQLSQYQYAQSRIQQNMRQSKINKSSMGSTLFQNTSKSTFFETQKLSFLDKKKEEEERQRQFEKEQEKQKELDRIKEQKRKDEEQRRELERQRQIDIERKKMIERQQEMERQQEIERQKEIQKKKDEELRQKYAKLKSPVQSIQELSGFQQKEDPDLIEITETSYEKPKIMIQKQDSIKQMKTSNETKKSLRLHSSPESQQMQFLDVPKPEDTARSQKQLDDIEEPKVFKSEGSKKQEMMESIYLDYCDKYKQYLSVINIIGLTIADLNEKLSASKNVWIMPLTVIFKRLYQIRMKVQEELELKRNSFSLLQFHGFVTSQKYQQLLKEITHQNEISKNEFQDLLNLAHKSTSLLKDQGQKDKILVLLNMDISKDIREQAVVYLYSQIYARIKKLINLSKSGQDKSKFSLLDYLHLRYKILISCGVLSLPYYTIDEETFNEVVFLRIDQLKQEVQIETECDEIELRLMNLMPK